MSERPILFSAPMVRALLAGSKTQTRRIVKPQPWVEAEMQEQSACSPEGWQIAGHSGIWEDASGDIFENWRCPYGVPGDTLWVREGFLREADPSPAGRGVGIWYRADGEPPAGGWTRPKPSIHMPRWASRISLRITDVRVERLNDIHGDDAWDDNPFVWAVSFEVLPKTADVLLDLANPPETT